MYDFSETFVKSMNQDDIIFKSQCILEFFSSIDSGFTFNLSHNNDNNISGIVCITSYMRDNFETFGNYISIDIMHLSICVVKEFYYIAPVVKNEIGKINVVCEGFLITIIHEAYTFVLGSLFNICPIRNKK